MKILPARKFLALDVALCNIGFAVITANRRILASGVISSRKIRGTRYALETDVFRSRFMALDLKSVIEDWDLECATAEFPSGGGMSKNAVAGMAMATGLVAATLGTCGLAVVPVHPNESKRLVKPKGEVSKKELEQFLAKSYDLSGIIKTAKREHVTDAIASFEVARRNEWI